MRRVCYRIEPLLHWGRALEPPTPHQGVPLPIKGFLVPTCGTRGASGLRAPAVAPTALPQSGQGPSSPINPAEPHPTCYRSIMTTARQTPPPSSSLPVLGTPPSSSLPVPGTPLKTDGRTMDQYESQYQHRSSTLQRLSYDMSRYFVGPVPPEEFLDEFLPLTSHPPAPEDHIFTKNMFSALKKVGTEAVMYHGLVTTLPDCQLPFMGLTPTF
jgi:hypothetical protein